MTLNQAELELIELVRGLDAKAFDLTISCSDRGWEAQTLSPNGKCRGEGASFELAWHSQDPGWPKSVQQNTSDTALRVAVKIIPVNPAPLRVVYRKL